jgi:allene oxide cyclase
MFTPKSTLLVVTATVAALVPALVVVHASDAQSARQHHGSQVIAVRETATFTSQIDNPPSGPSAGDAVTFTGTLVGHRNGTEQGSCTFVTSTRTQCSISASFASGQLVFNGILPFDQTDFEIPLTGGTGEFSRARGFVAVHVTNATGTVDDLVIHILD